MKNKKMKNDIKEEKQKFTAANNNYGQRFWRVVAIAVIVLFAVIIAVGLIKAHYIKSSFIKPTQAQIDYATKIAAEKLQSTGGNASAFQIQVGRKMRMLHDDGAAKTIIQVSFYNNATTHIYLVDVNSGKVLLHSETDIYSTFGNRHKENRREKLGYLFDFYPRFFEH